MTWLWLSLASPASAAELYLEGPPVSTRAEAASMAQAATAEGLRARVVRRYRHPGGWEFVFRVEGFEEADSAADAARLLTERTGRGMVVYEAVDGVARRVGANAAPPPDAAQGDDAPPEDAPSPLERPPEDPGAATDDPHDVDALVARARRAHGGADGGAAVIEGRDVLFRFRRELPDGMVADHTYARRGGDTYLSVEIDGDGVSSRTWILGDRAWMSEAGGPPTEQDPSRTREVVARFAPEEILAIPLGLARALETRPELQRLYLDGVTTVGGQPCQVLGYDGDRVQGPLALALDRETWRVRQLAFGNDAGGIIHQFDAYEQLGAGLMLPREITTWRRQDQVDLVRILDLDPEARLPDEWFAAPDSE